MNFKVTNKKQTVKSPILNIIVLLCGKSQMSLPEGFYQTPLFFRFEVMEASVITEKGLSSLCMAHEVFDQNKTICFFQFTIKLCPFPKPL